MKGLYGIAKSVASIAAGTVVSEGTERAIKELEKYLLEKGIDQIPIPVWMKLFLKTGSGIVTFLVTMDSFTIMEGNLVKKKDKE